ncbi:unnamed protein product [Boreogadus saida]
MKGKPEVDLENHPFFVTFVTPKAMNYRQYASTNVRYYNCAQTLRNRISRSDYTSHSAESFFLLRFVTSATRLPHLPRALSQPIGKDEEVSQNLS